MKKISREESRRRMAEWRNYKNILHPRLKVRSEELKKKNKALAMENARLKQEVKEENAQIEKLLLQLEELRAMKFGKKRQSPQKATPIPSEEHGEGQWKEGGGDEEDTEDAQQAKGNRRDPEGYRRPLPLPHQITDRLHLEISACPACDGPLFDKKEHIHYREDLKDVEKLLEAAKKIVETTIESGRCKPCGERQFALEIPKQKVILGENVRQMIVYLNVMMGHSYSEVKRSLDHQYGIRLSSGQISNILEGESRLLTPYYNSLTRSLEEESKIGGAHYDETTWKTGSRGEEVAQGNYCWVKVGVESSNRLFWFGKSRGKGVAEKLRGDKEGARGVSDDYGSYRNLFEVHQLCWAHPHRKFRDLAESQMLSPPAKRVCQKAFTAFATVYKKAEKIRKQIKEGALKGERKDGVRLRLEKKFSTLFLSHPSDPQKLKTLRKTLEERKDRYFTFFDHPFLPLDNNKAERAIRKIVLKRKKSFGCKSQKGANILSILYSVVFSLIESHPDKSFFELYRQAMEFEE